MRFVRLLAASAALACSGLAGQAQAAVPIISYTGSFQLGYGETVGTFIDTGPSIFGKVRTVLRTSQPLEELDLYVHNFYQYDYYNYLDEELGGNEFDNYIPAYGYPYPAQKAVDLSYFYPLERQDYSVIPDVYTVSYKTSSNELGGVEFSLLAPFGPVAGFTPGKVDWRIDLYAQAVPEPATWALMILGFGAVGAAMRRSRANRGALRPQTA